MGKAETFSLVIMNQPFSTRLAFKVRAQGFVAVEVRCKVVQAGLSQHLGSGFRSEAYGWSRCEEASKP